MTYDFRMEHFSNIRFYLFNVRFYSSNVRFFCFFEGDADVQCPIIEQIMLIYRKIS